MRKIITMFGLLGLLFITPAMARAACTVNNTVTVPMTGVGTIVPVDTTTCQTLDATAFSAGIPGSSLNSNTKPAFTADANGLHLAANGMSFGSTVNVTFNYPNGRSFSMAVTIGGPVTPGGMTATP